MSNSQSNLLPDRHPQLDFFVCNLVDVPAKSDRVSMEHPIFSLSPCWTERYYEHKGEWIKITPSNEFGSATINDRDILIYCISQCMHALNNNRPISPVIRFIASDLLKATNRTTKGGSGYQGLYNAINRLLDTKIQTNIINGGVQVESGFKLLDSYNIIRECPNGRMLEIEITLPHWIFKAIQKNNVLTINRDYFLLRKPLAKRMYELARKFCGRQRYWPIRLSLLHLKSGAQIKKLSSFKREVNAIIEADRKENFMPDYSFGFKNPEEPDPIVMFFPKSKIHPKTNLQVNQPQQRLYISTEAIQRAKKFAPGFDIYAIQTEWQEFVIKKNIIVEVPEAHFISFVKTWVENRQLNLGF